MLGDDDHLRPPEFGVGALEARTDEMDVMRGGEPGVEAMSIGADFDRFYTRSAPRAMRLAMALTGRWADAEDLTQEAFTAAHRAWDRVGGYDDPAAWVERVILNRTRTRWRRSGREAVALARWSARANTHQAADALPPDADGDFWVAVRRLPVRQRDAVVLYYVTDLAVAEVAQRLGCTEGSVKTHLSRARRALHEHLRDGESTDRTLEGGGR